VINLLHKAKSKSYCAVVVFGVVGIFAILREIELPPVKIIL
jgi:hypothetical protein